MEALLTSTWQIRLRHDDPAKVLSAVTPDVPIDADLIRLLIVARLDVHTVKSAPDRA
jgi:hypothetical protein